MATEMHFQVPGAVSDVDYFVSSVSVLSAADIDQTPFEVSCQALIEAGFSCKRLSLLNFYNYSHTVNNTRMNLISLSVDGVDERLEVNSNSALHKNDVKPFRVGRE